MKISNPIVRGFYVGLIAGIIGGIGVNIWRIIEALLGLPTAIPGMLTIETILYHLSYEIGAVGIFGAIFGIFYSKFYKAIPGKGIKKGLFFGSVMFLFSNIWQSSNHFLAFLFTGIEQYFLWTIEIAMGFTCLIPYGLVLGLLYERWK